tara:strand:+ start:1317 stop:1490 length:174 start_codon:yes stop_codon:yes gene_type:complete
MKKITDNKNWNVYSEPCGMTSMQFYVMNKDMEEDMCFVNDKTRAMAVCDALNKANVK